ncbi:STAS domain-containing protein [Streptomyces longispororuber]|uniref:STAS domain-containing protein n=1 Tax=Streptomyces longispororuber TaxID=68230 RepID=UPI0033E773FF
MNPLQITARDAATGPVLEITGALDHHTAPHLRAHVTATPLDAGRRLVLDLEGVTFCDSSGISALIAARHHAHTARADIALAAVPANMLRILRIVGLDQIFPLHPDAATATRPTPASP